MNGKLCTVKVKKNKMAKIKNTTDTSGETTGDTEDALVAGPWRSTFGLHLPGWGSGGLSQFLAPGP